MSSAEVKMGGGSVAPFSGGRLGPRVRDPGSGVRAPGSGLRAPALDFFFPFVLVRARALDVLPPSCPLRARAWNSFPFFFPGEKWEVKKIRVSFFY